mgnify:CR=1 FL=1
MRREGKKTLIAEGRWRDERRRPRESNGSGFSCFILFFHRRSSQRASHLAPRGKAIAEIIFVRLFLLEDPEPVVEIGETPCCLRRRVGLER